MPDLHSGVIPESGGETWMAVEKALSQGSRGLRMHYSLCKLIRLYRNLQLRAHWELPLSDGVVSGGTPAEVAARILVRRAEPRAVASGRLPR